MKSLPLLALIGTISIGTAFANVYVPTQIKHNYEHCGNAYCDYQNQNLPPPPKLIAVSVDTKTGVFAAASTSGHFQSDVNRVTALAKENCKRRAKRWRCDSSEVRFFNNNTADWFGHAVIVRGINPDIPPNKKNRYGFAIHAYISNQGKNDIPLEQSLLKSCQTQGWEQCQVVFHNNDHQW